jgi:hypothetical protein
LGIVRYRAGDGYNHSHRRDGANRRANKQQTPAAVEAAEMIPEHAMVALAALQQIKPALLHESEEWLFETPLNPAGHRRVTDGDI